MNPETNCFSLFEIFDNRMGTKKKLYITKNLDVYTTRGEDPRRVIRVHWEVAKTDEELRRDYRKRGQHYPCHRYKKLFPYTAEGLEDAIDYLGTLPENAL